MKKKRAQARRPKVRKPEVGRPEPPEPQAREPAPPPPAPPEPCGDDCTLSIEAMLCAQIAETHLAAMDCLRHARSPDSPEQRHQALTHATRLLSLFTRQVKTLRQGLWDAPAAGHGARPAVVAVAPDTAEPEEVVPDEIPPEIAAAVRDTMAAWTGDTLPAAGPPGTAFPAPGDGP